MLVIKPMIAFTSCEDDVPPVKLRLPHTQRLAPRALSFHARELETTE